MWLISHALPQAKRSSRVRRILLSSHPIAGAAHGDGRIDSRPRFLLSLAAVIGSGTFAGDRARPTESGLTAKTVLLLFRVPLFMEAKAEEDEKAGFKSPSNPLPSQPAEDLTNDPQYSHTCAAVPSVTCFLHQPAAACTVDEAMGLFNRKNPGSSTNGNANGLASNASSLKSPPGPKTSNGPAFDSPSMLNVSLPGPPDPSLDPAAYLRSIYAVRQRSRFIIVNAKRNQLAHFDVDPAKWKDNVDYVTRIIKRDFAPDYSKIPPHGRWQHFEAGGRPRIDQLLATWGSSVDNQERTRRLIDLFLVSVLLDAGAGTRWSYKSKESGKIYRRSEGLAIASLEMFKAGYFSSDELTPCQVDYVGLKRLTAQQLARGLQVSETNPIMGLDGRAGLLSRLADALRNKGLFGTDGRPGNMLDYLLSHPSTQASSVPIVTVPTLWNVLINGLASIWPNTRTQIDGLSLGDAWPCSSMPSSPPAQPWENIIPFHKLTQWLCYSLMTPMTKLLQIRFAGTDLLTGLPEYRNGGLFVDTGYLTLKEKDRQRGIEAYMRNAMVKGQPNMEVVPLFTADDDVIVEWRAVTVGLLDDLLPEVNRQLGLQGADKLSLAQMLEAGSWKGGRELAEVSRPNTKEPPIMILSDGTVF